MSMQRLTELSRRALLWLVAAMRRRPLATAGALAGFFAGLWLGNAGLAIGGGAVLIFTWAALGGAGWFLGDYVSDKRALRRLRDPRR
jgi:hypothetical protein